MSGDFTRQTFQKNKYYTGVRLQQGRVQVDADFNEQVDILHHRERTTTTDVVGVTGMPEDAPGFAVSEVNGDFILGTGRAYVDGILVEHEIAPNTLEKVSGNGVNTVWEVAHGPRLLENQWLIEVDSVDKVAFQVTGIIAPQDGYGGKQRLRVAKDLGDGPVILSGLASIAIQPNLPAEALPDGASHYIAYLDVWEREITALEDPKIKDIALGEVDTAVRTQAVWQVKLLALQPGVGGISNPPVCADFGPGWSPDGDEEPIRLAAQTDPAAQITNPCVLPSRGGYRDLDNHLYRVQIHNGGKVGQDTVFIKWSRDNAIYRSRLIDKKGGNLVVEDAGKDSVSLFKPDDWVEVLDEARILAGNPGFFVRVGGVVDNSLEVKEVLNPNTLDLETDGGNPNTGLLPQTGLVRRWEGGKPIEVNPENWIPLEKGIEVQVREGLSATADYWLIPARTLSADIEWPTDPADGSPAFELPLGIRHHYAALALVKPDDDGVREISDCRNIFPPLTRFKSLFYVGGDGQEAAPDPGQPNEKLRLREPIRVGVSRGSTPVEGATVRFRVTKGNGHLTGNQPEAKVTTVAGGTAAVNWWLDSTTLDQHVTAELIDSADDSQHLPVVFTGRLRRANEVSFDPPADCLSLQGRTTVQKALEALCTIESGGCPTYIVGPDNWIAVLRTLRPNEDAHICFQRGQFKAPGVVEMENLGHISLSGVGDGTEITAHGSEMALHFINCKSVTVESMQIAATDGGRAIGHKRGINGVLTTSKCANVDIHNTSIRCGASAAFERTCITVRASNSSEDHQEEVPMIACKSIRIRSNRLAVGHGQNGILVTNAKRVRIEDNEFDVVKRPKSLTFERLLEDPRRSHKLANQLLKDAVLEDTGPSMGNTVTLRAGRFTARFQSIVPESEFQVLMGRNEPQELDLESAENFSAYWRGLLENATENAQELPSYNTTLERFRPTIEGGLTPAFRKEMLFSGEVVVNEFQELQEERRGVAIALDDNRLQFNSPIPQNRWTDIIRAHQPAPIQSNVDLLNTGREAALRLVTDRNFRDRFDDVRTWFEKRKQQNPSVGHQAIVCGGQVLEDVHIKNNNVAGFYEGIHVGVSHRTSRSDPHLMAGGIYICENRITLRTPMEEFEGQYGIFAGNSNRIALENNELINLPARSIQEYRAGILVWGYLGSFVVLRQNSTARCQTGIRVVAQGSTSKASQRLWRAVDNLTDSDSISLPSDFIERDNVTAKGINNTYHNQEEN